MRISAAILCFGIALASGPACAQSLVYRVDKATAVLDGRDLLVHVKGAARTGGWEHPHLVVHGAADGKHLEIHFVATPPQDASAVVQSEVPVNVSLKTRAPGKGVSAVKVVSATNAVTARIVTKAPRQRTAQN